VFENMGTKGHCTFLFGSRVNERRLSPDRGYHEEV